MNKKAKIDNKSKIMISIKPIHAENIIAGIKKYEYRRRVAKEAISSLIIYETSPVKLVVAEVEVLDILTLPTEELWELTKDDSGINKIFYCSYFKDKKVAFAYKLGKVTKFNKQKSLSEYGIKRAPQSFVYIR